MGQILGLGLTHSPPLLAAAGDTTSRIKRMMNDPLLPERYRSPATWPAPMRQQWGNDEGKTHAQQHRAELVECMRMSKVFPVRRTYNFVPAMENNPGPPISRASIP